MPMRLRAALLFDRAPWARQARFASREDGLRAGRPGRCACEGRAARVVSAVADHVSPLSFQLKARDRDSLARRGELVTVARPHAVVQTPAFMPVGTRATVTGLEPRDVAAARRAGRARPTPTT